MEYMEQSEHMCSTMKCSDSASSTFSITGSIDRGGKGKETSKKRKRIKGKKRIKDGEERKPFYQQSEWKYE